jgi:hypothetical protein
MRDRQRRRLDRLFVQKLPDNGGTKRRFAHLGAGVGNRVSYGVRYSGVSADSAALAYPFYAKRVQVEDGMARIVGVPAKGFTIVRSCPCSR